MDQAIRWRIGHYRFSWRWLCPFLLGLIGVIIAYFIKDDKKKNRVKWSWIGWGIYVVLYLVILLAIL